MTRNHAIDTIDLRFFEVMNKIGDAARARGDLESVNDLIQAMILYMESRRAGGLDDTG
jgi:hypothetical protein